MTASDWWRSKTFWTAVAGIVAAVAGVLHGDLTWAQAGAAIFAAIQSFNLRDTIRKAGETTARAAKRASSH